ncbi:hypothetical protein ANCDUO_26655 [Ancylostoma duodenale]|uniref:RGS domain-containing protein n=1 Tax=Ancylostoma duodenale TaxID=51022 RepID=A0A0C2C180_9BILA|nr:hypothetical protein ANCDUO_26655 [Ancylostoma duodenale]
MMMSTIANLAPDKGPFMKLHLSCSFVGRFLSDGLILPETNASRDMKIFKRVLRDPKLRQPFQLFLEQQFCAENLNFYVAVERFRDMQFNNESKVSSLVTG